MTKCNRAFALPAALFFVSAVFLTPSSVNAQSVVMGANLLNNPDRLAAADQDAILDAMKSGGVRVIRASISNNAKGFEFAERVYAHDIKLEWLAGVKGPFVSETVLSSADPDQFRAYFQPMLSKLEASGFVLAGIELGNEINWSASNRDLSEPRGKVLGLEDLKRDPEGQVVAKGYLNYVKVLAALKDIRDHSKMNQRTPIIAAGLSPWEPGAPDAAPTNKDAVSLKATIQFLRANGADELVDAYGVHAYPRGDVTPAERLASLQQIFAECRSAKPCWLTEWGLPVSSGKACPVVDDKRTAIFTELRRDFSQLAKQDRLKGAMFFTWQGNIHDENPYSAFLCGSLTKSGKLAVAPL